MYFSVCFFQICNNGNLTNTCGNQDNFNCDMLTNLCKCNSNFYSKNCDLKINIQNIQSGISSADFNLLITISLLVYSSSLISGVLLIFYIFKIKENKIKVKNNLNKSDHERHTEKASINMISIDIKEPKESEEEFKFSQLKIFMSNLEIELEQCAIDNKFIKNILDNIHSYFNLHKKINRIVLQNIYNEIDNLFNLFQNNNIQFINFNYKRFERQLNQLKNSTKHDNFQINSDKSINNHNDIKLSITKEKKRPIAYDDYIEVNNKEEETMRNVENDNEVVDDPIRTEEHIVVDSNDLFVESNADILKRSSKKAKKNKDNNKIKSVDVKFKHKSNPLGALKTLNLIKNKLSFSLKKKIPLSIAKDYTSPENYDKLETSERQRSDKTNEHINMYQESQADFLPK